MNLVSLHAQCNDCLQKIFEFVQEPVDLLNLSRVCTVFKGLIDSHPLWEQKALAWNAADWSSPEDRSFKNQTLEFVKKYNTFLVSKIIQDSSFISSDDKNNAFCIRQEIEKKCHELADEIFQEKLKAELKNECFQRRTGLREEGYGYIPLDSNKILYCYMALEAGLKPEKKLFYTAIRCKAPLSLIKSFHKDQSDLIDDSSLRSAICSGQPMETISHLMKEGATLNECTFIDAVMGRQPLEIFKKLKEMEAEISASNTLDLAIEFGVHDPGIIEILVNLYLEKEIELDRNIINHGLHYKLPLASMQALLNSGVVADSIAWWMAENRSREESNKRIAQKFKELEEVHGFSYARSMMQWEIQRTNYPQPMSRVDYFVEWAVKWQAPVEILRALIAAGAKVQNTFNMRLAVELEGINPEIMKELLEQGGEVTSRHLLIAKRCQSAEIVKMLEEHLA